jgi:regulator of replication initiation timing
VPEEVLEKLKSQEDCIARQEEELARAAENGQIALDENQRLRKENSRLQDEIAEQEELINDAQSQYDQMRNELLTLQSTAAKGDAERIPADELTAENFAAAVRQFVGSCARMPHMARTFATMSLSERNAYEELLCTVESWAQGARKAMESIHVEEV